MGTNAGSTWAGTHTFAATTLHEPTQLSQAQELIAAAPRIRALGSRHSFNDLADSPGELISLRQVPLPLEVDDQASTAVVNGSLTYGDVATELDEAGFALPALASLPHISIAGAVATATHGSGNQAQSLAANVVGIELIGPDGETRWLERGDDDFPGAVVSLGALGVVARMRLSVEPSFAVRQDVVNGVTWETVLAEYHAITEAAHSVSIFTRWEADRPDQIWFKSRSDHGPTKLFGGELATDHQHPILGIDPVNATRQLGESGPWYDRLPHFRMGFTPSNGTEIQSEYLLGREHAVPAIQALLAVGDSIRPLLQVCEIRTVAADDLWLSSAYERDVVAFHFTFVQDPESVRLLLPLIEGALAPFGARPHWGKWFTQDRDALAALYPRIGDFRSLAARLDPERKFSNDYLDRLVL